VSETLRFKVIHDVVCIIFSAKGCNSTTYIIDFEGQFSELKSIISKEVFINMWKQILGKVKAALLSHWSELVWFVIGAALGVFVLAGWVA